MKGVFVAGGTMKPDALTYIERSADTELFSAIMAGQYCSVFSTRQVGKSSLMARTAARLRGQGVQCATIDLQGTTDRQDQWYYSFLKKLIDSLNLTVDLPSWWKQQELLAPAERLTDFLGDIVLKATSSAPNLNPPTTPDLFVNPDPTFNPSTPSDQSSNTPNRAAHVSKRWPTSDPSPQPSFVIFIDEVDWMIRLPFSDEFFAVIRSCFNRRATDPAFERLTFVLLGSAAPAQLIKDATRTPFNIGRGIELTDFTADEAKRFADWLGPNGNQILSRILYWTDGHPYLTQMLCQQAADWGTQESAVDSLVQDKLLSPNARQEENNLKFVADRLTQATPDLRLVLRAYQKVLRGKPVRDVAFSRVHTSLRLSGAVKMNSQHYLKVRNRIYQTVFNEAWVREKTPLDRRSVFTVASFTVLLAIFSTWYFLVFPRPHIQALQTSSADIDVAYQAYDSLQKPFHRAQANDLLARFFERRDDRDSAIMLRARSGDTTQLARLVGADYPLLRTTLRHEGEVNVVAFSLVGSLLATGSRDNTARVFDAASGHELARLVHEGEVLAVAFSPDGRRVATGSEDKTARVFDAESGRELVRLVHEGVVDAVAFSPDGRRVATGSYYTARVFDAAGGREMARLVHQSIVAAVAFSPDGSRVATGSRDKTARVFDAGSGREVARLVHEGVVDAVAFSPDGRRVATGSEDKTARVFDAESGRELVRLVHEGVVDAVAFSPDGRRVATGSYYTARVFDAAGGREMARLVHQSIVAAVAFSPDGSRVATGSRDKTARVFDAGSGREVARLVHEGVVDAVAFSPDGRRVATGSEDKTARVFDAESGREMAHLVHQSITAVAFSPDGGRVVTGSEDKTARVFDVASGQELPHLVHQGMVTAVTFSPDGRRAVTGSEDKTARVFDVASGREVARLFHQGTVDAVAFSPDGRRAVTGSEDKTARVFDVASGLELAHLVHQSTVTAVAFSPDGSRVATGSFDKTVRVFDAASGRELALLAQQDIVETVAFSPDDKFFLTQTGNWLHLYSRSGDSLTPIANRFLPVIWPNTARFLTPSAHCPKCIEVVRDVPENLIKLDRTNFDDPTPPPGSPIIHGTAEQLVAEWGAKLGLTFDSRGRVVPVSSK